MGTRRRESQQPGSSRQSRRGVRPSRRTGGGFTKVSAAECLKVELPEGTTIHLGGASVIPRGWATLHRARVLDGCRVAV